MQLDKLKDGMSLNEDFLFLRRLHECQKPEGVESSLLDCKKITDRLKHLLMKEDNTKKDTETYEKLKVADVRRHPVAAHLAGIKKGNKSVPGFSLPQSSAAHVENLDKIAEF
ncbi:CD40 ligand isoform B [Alligator mississippiensis]|uniref:CD40 ligand isoform B n=1 Tax=Alligator mississippiensis TaxID=8496 RepID=A0A151N7H5_ALLMI|nr:CD40 ligand isoform B [Alligator mississippiensis]